VLLCPSLTVLSMYLGQLMLMKRLANDADNTSSHVLTITGQRIGDVRMSTTDNYQGEERDIVRTQPTALVFHLFFLGLLSRSVFDMKFTPLTPLLIRVKLSRILFGCYCITSDVPKFYFCPIVARHQGPTVAHAFQLRRENRIREGNE
jgi:hypothetical protein